MLLKFNNQGYVYPIIFSVIPVNFSSYICMLYSEVRSISRPLLNVEAEVGCRDGLACLDGKKIN